MSDTPADDGLLTPSEFARAMRVDPKTVTRWAKDGKIPALPDGRRGYLFTPGGHIRFRRAALNLILDAHNREDD